LIELRKLSHTSLPFSERPFYSQGLVSSFRNIFRNELEEAEWGVHGPAVPITVDAL